MAPLTAQIATLAQSSTPVLATVGAVTQTPYRDDNRLQSMMDRAMMSANTASAEQLEIMIELLKKIIDLIENLDLVVNIDIRELRKKLKDLEKRSGVKFD